MEAVAQSHDEPEEIIAEQGQEVHQQQHATRTTPPYVNGKYVNPWDTWKKLGLMQALKWSSKRKPPKPTKEVCEAVCAPSVCALEQLALLSVCAYA